MKVCLSRAYCHRLWFRDSTQWETTNNILALFLSSCISKCCLSVRHALLKVDVEKSCTWKLQVIHICSLIKWFLKLWASPGMVGFSRQVGHNWQVQWGAGSKSRDFWCMLWGKQGSVRDPRLISREAVWFGDVGWIAWNSLVCNVSLQGVLAWGKIVPFSCLDRFKGWLWEIGIVSRWSSVLSQDENAWRRNWCLLAVSSNVGAFTKGERVFES